MTRLEKVEELRTRFLRLAVQEDFAIGAALQTIDAAVKLAGHTEGEAGRAWKKGLSDAGHILRYVRETHDRFQAVLREMAEASGFSEDEREAMFGPRRRPTPAVTVTPATPATPPTPA